MAGLKVIPVKVLPNGALDLEDLQSKAEIHKDKLAAFMVSSFLRFCMVNDADGLPRSHTRPHSECSKTVSKKLAKSSIATADRFILMVGRLRISDSWS